MRLSRYREWRELRLARRSLSTSSSSSSQGQAHTRANSNGLVDLAPPRAPSDGGETCGLVQLRGREIVRALPSAAGVPESAGGLVTPADTPTPSAALRSAGCFPPSSAHNRARSGWSGAAFAHGAGPGTSDTPRDTGTRVHRDPNRAMARAATAAPPIWVVVQGVLDEGPDIFPMDEGRTRRT